MIRWALVCGVAGWLSIYPLMADNPPLSKLHVVLVLDTLDQSLSKSIIVDRNKLTKLLNDHIPQDRWTLTEFSGMDAHSSKLLPHLRSLKLSAEQGLFVYFSCHGETVGNGDHRLLLTRGKTQISQIEAIRRSDLLNDMRKSNAGLVLLISDACNVTVSPTRAIALPSKARNFSTGPTKITPIIESLFFRSRGVVDINSSFESEAAWSHDLTGGLFTSTMISTLTEDRLVRRGDMTWVEFYCRLKERNEKRFLEWKAAETDGTARSKKWNARLSEGELSIDKAKNQTPQLFHMSDIKSGLVIEIINRKCIVQDITLDCPARSAGLRVGDVIASVNGQAIASYNDWFAAIDKVLANRKVPAKFVTGSGRNLTVQYK